MARKFDLSNVYPTVINNLESVLDINQGDFRYFNQWMANKTTLSYVVQSHEVNRLDLISYTNYGTPELWWVIGQFNGIVKFSEVQAGLVLNIPDMAQIESYIQLIKSIKNGQSVAIRQ